MLLTASIAGMDPRVVAARKFYKDMIVDEITAKMAAASAGASATTSASTPDREVVATSAERPRWHQPCEYPCVSIGEYPIDGINITDRACRCCPASRASAD
jgi:hypothetical protein